MNAIRGQGMFYTDALLSTTDRPLTLWSMIERPMVRHVSAFHSMAQPYQDFWCAME